MAAGTVSFRYFILGLLAQKEMSGYDIKRFVESLGWLIGAPSFGSLYPALHTLLEDNLVEVTAHTCQDKPPRKTYRLTQPGKRALDEWINQPVNASAPLKDFVMRLILANNFAPHGLMAHLAQRREQVVAHQATLEQVLSASDEDADLRQHLALDYGLALAAAEVVWLDSALHRLSELSKELLPAEVV